MDFTLPIAMHIIFGFMGWKPLALLFGLLTAMIGVVIALLWSKCNPYGFEAGLITTAIVFFISSCVLVIMINRKWALSYAIRFEILFYASLSCALLYAPGIAFLVEGEGFNFCGIWLLTVLLFKLPIDLTVALFRKNYAA